MSWSKPTPAAETSLATIRSTPLAAILAEARSTASPVSAANPPSTSANQSIV